MIALIQERSVLDADEALWEAYRQGEEGAFDRLTEAYLPLVKVTVGRMAVTLPSFIDYEELYSTGCYGLLLAIQRYDPNREAKFSTYAITRIRGAVIDELRSHDMLGRITRERVTKIRHIEEKARASGVPLSSQEIAEEAGLSMDEYYDALRGDRASHMVSLSEPIAHEEGTQRLSELIAAKEITGDRSLTMEDEELIDYVISQLSEREALLVTLYYHEELTLKEIGKIMEVSESRVSQLHTEMMVNVRKKLKKIGI